MSDVFGGYEPELLHDAVSISLIEGKGRGLTVSEAIEEGEMLLCEIAALQCFDDLGQTLLVAAMLLAGPDEEGLLSHLLHLHPEALQAETLPEEQTAALVFAEAWCDKMQSDCELGRVIEANRELLLLLGMKATMNAFSSGVYLFISMLNHSCCNNCEIVQHSGMAHVIANSTIPAGSELTIRYGNVDELPGRYGFQCACEVCEQSKESIQSAIQEHGKECDLRRGQLVHDVMLSLQ